MAPSKEKKQASADEEDPRHHGDVAIVDERTTKGQAHVKFNDTAIHIKKSRLGITSYYEEATINGVSFKVGDFALIRNVELPEAPSFVVQILSMANDLKEQVAHVRFFCHAEDTILGDFADSSEVCILPTCEDVRLSDVMGKAEVTYWPPSDNWRQEGGSEIGAEKQPPVNRSKLSFYFRHAYDNDLVRFTTPNMTSVDAAPQLAKTGDCPLCESIRREMEAKKPQFQEGAMMLMGETYRLGEAVFLPPSYRPRTAVKSEDDDLKIICDKSYDRKLYTERYRKVKLTVSQQSYS